MIKGPKVRDTKGPNIEELLKNNSIIQFYSNG